MCHQLTVSSWWLSFEARDLEGSWMQGWWQGGLGEEVYRGLHRMDPEYEGIWFFVNMYPKDSTIEEALNN